LTLPKTEVKLARLPQVLPVKTFRLPRTVVTDIEQLIAADKPLPGRPSALARILKSLCDGRHYVRAGIFLSINGREVPCAMCGPQATPRDAGEELSVRIKIAAHSFGSLRVQLAPGHVFSLEERVLLDEVAIVLARYLSGKGKYIVRKTREALRASAPAGSGEARGYQPVSDHGRTELRLAAAGDKSRS
jgi:hypothetical protein